MQYVSFVCALQASHTSKGTCSRDARACRGEDTEEIQFNAEIPKRYRFCGT